MLSMMALASPIISILLGILALVTMILIQVFEGGSIFSVGSMILWMGIASAILIWKFSSRRSM